MKPTLTEGKLLIYTLIATGLLVSVFVFQRQLSELYNPINTLSFHIIFEFFAIAISFSIFLYGWKKYKQTKSAKLLLLALVFLIVGLIDLLHTLTFKGMPFFLTESSVAKATWFWVIARTFQALAMLILLLVPDRKLEHDPRNLLLLASTFIVIFIGYIVFMFEKSLPVLVIEGTGTTFIKNAIEYFVCSLLIASIFVSLLSYNVKKNQDYLYYALAFTILFLSELVFTIYQSVYDIVNFSGHIFKVVGYFFILKGFYYSIENETFAKEHQQKDHFQLKDLIREYQGILFTFRKVDSKFIHTTCDGELLYELGVVPEQVIGKTMLEVFPAKGAWIEEQYKRCWETGVNVTCKLPLENKELLLNLKPLYKENKVVEVLGTVHDITQIEESDLKLHRYATF